MKALKITLMIALFVSVSSQTDLKPSNDSVDKYETIKKHFDLIAHNRAGAVVPSQG